MYVIRNDIKKLNCNKNRLKGRSLGFDISNPQNMINTPFGNQFLGFEARNDWSLNTKSLSFY